MLAGPALVAAVAYVDPGNFATNFTAGAAYHYELLWVLVAANVMAAQMQYLSAKVGLATGKSLPTIIAERLPLWPKRLFWLQAEGVAIATDIAEVIGGAVALNLLFGLPLFVGGLIVGVVSLVILGIYNDRGIDRYKLVIAGLLAVIPLGFIAALVLHPLAPGAMASGLLPALRNTDMAILASAMLGATIMPHVIYLHSSLVRDKYGAVPQKLVPRLLKATKLEIVVVMGAVGLINISMLLAAASVGQGNGSSLGDIHAAFTQSFGGWVAALFAFGLLASGLASTAVGSQAGSTITGDMLGRDWPALARRIATLLPALLVLFVVQEPTRLLIMSQVVLSFGIPFALIALLYVSSHPAIMGHFANKWPVAIAGWSVAVLVSSLNIYLLSTLFIQ